MRRNSDTSRPSRFSPTSSTRVLRLTQPAPPFVPASAAPAEKPTLANGRQKKRVMTQSLVIAPAKLALSSPTAPRIAGAPGKRVENRGQELFFLLRRRPPTPSSAPSAKRPECPSRRTLPPLPPTPPPPSPPSPPSLTSQKLPQPTPPRPLLPRARNPPRPSGAQAARPPLLPSGAQQRRRVHRACGAGRRRRGRRPRCGRELGGGRR